MLGGSCTISTSKATLAGSDVEAHQTLIDRIWEWSEDAQSEDEYAMLYDRLQRYLSKDTVEAEIEKAERWLLAPASFRYRDPTFFDYEQQQQPSCSRSISGSGSGAGSGSQPPCSPSSKKYKQKTQKRKKKEKKSSSILQKPTIPAQEEDITLSHDASAAFSNDRVCETQSHTSPAPYHTAPQRKSLESQPSTEQNSTAPHREEGAPSLRTTPLTTLPHQVLPSSTEVLPYFLQTSLPTRLNPQCLLLSETHPHRPTTWITSILTRASAFAAIRDHSPCVVLSYIIAYISGSPDYRAVVHQLQSKNSQQSASAPSAGLAKHKSQPAVSESNRLIASLLTHYIPDWFRFLTASGPTEEEIIQFFKEFIHDTDARRIESQETVITQQILAEPGNLDTLLAKLGYDFSNCCLPRLEEVEQRTTTVYWLIQFIKELRIPWLGTPAIAFKTHPVLE
ncbi:uncharacterized protein MYCFIDRAFT_84608 [Pseudocercospora fijiensis CIRAD86]|uniref:Uncharacterized protein n=1 Tax=Pseudocercospora fijiensis (strain CIRAD86) TaxID=383855 RepID=M2ZYB8_PSEFD|nr:uncharacterized protein MYCFIDRAFT_84608 [Pseudocercospora fijiensis CIRAD86]EME77111.1 hypothetical protein MYCFIDRAFT_84608 [Pseudocercospora fijiensis CIRAD86]